MHSLRYKCDDAHIWRFGDEAHSCGWAGDVQREAPHVKRRDDGAPFEQVRVVAHLYDIQHRVCCPMTTLCGASMVSYLANVQL